MISPDKRLERLEETSLQILELIDYHSEVKTDYIQTY